MIAISAEPEEMNNDNALPSHSWRSLKGASIGSEKVIGNLKTSRQGEGKKGALGERLRATFQQRTTDLEKKKERSK